MVQLNIDGVLFDFNERVLVSQYDSWKFYRNRFSKIRSGLKAVDLIVCEDRTVYFVEVKDYRRHPRTKLIDLADEVKIKVLDTLSALLPAGCNANDKNEAVFARNVFRATKIRVVLHLEQPIYHSKLFPRVVDPANIKLKMRQSLKSIDAHPIISQISDLGGVPWSVQ